jgi:hypothetical protein
MYSNFVAIDGVIKNELNTHVLFLLFQFQFLNEESRFIRLLLLATNTPNIWQERHAFLF